MSLPEGHPGVVLGAPLTLQALPSCERIRLWLVDAKADLDACYRAAWDVDTTPMWAFCWGSGLALARYLLDHPEVVRDKVVVDFGCGSGVAAIAAAIAGAARAIAVDCDEDALAFARANAEANAVALETRRALPRDYDLLLASDVLYDREARDYLDRERAPDRPMLLVDGLRPGTVHPEESPFHEMPSRTFPDVDPPIDHAWFYWIGSESP